MRVRHCDVTAPRDRQGGLASVQWPYTTMDDEGLPLSSPLPLSQPAVQALIDNQDALLSSQSTGDVEMEESHMVIMQNSAPASSSSFLETTEKQDDDADGEPPSVGGAPPPSPTSTPTVAASRPTPKTDDARPSTRALIDELLLPPGDKSSPPDEDPLLCHPLPNQLGVCNPAARERRRITRSAARPRSRRPATRR